MPKGNEYITAQRLIELVALVDNGREISIPMIQRKWSVNRACADNYIDFVRRLRPDLDCRRRTAVKLWSRKRSGATDLAINTAAVLDMAVRALAPLRGTELHNLLADLLEEHRGRLHDSVDIADRRARAFQVLDPRRVTASSKVDVLRALLDAIIGRSRCEIEYRALKDTTLSYEIEPWSFVWVRQSLFLLARHADNGERRNFELDGIRQVTSIGGTFTPPSTEEMDVEVVYADAFGSYAGYGTPVDVHLRVRGSHAVYLSRRVVHRSQQVSPADAEGWTDVRFRVVVCPEFTSFVLGMLPEVEVVGPVSLAKIISEVVRAYRGTQMDP